MHKKSHSPQKPKSTELRKLSKDERKVHKQVENLFQNKASRRNTIYLKSTQERRIQNDNPENLKKDINRLSTLNASRDSEVRT